LAEKSITNFLIELLLQRLSLLSCLVTLAACSGCNGLSSVRPSVCPSVPSAHAQRDSSRSGQRTFPSDYYGDGHTGFISVEFLHCIAMLVLLFVS